MDATETMTAALRTSVAPPRRVLTFSFSPILLAAIVFAAVAPTLGWLEFSNSLENLNVTTATEIRRTGHWLVPTLQGRVRVEKPPLAEWIGAALIPSSTLRDMASTDAAIRDAAFARLQWQARLPSLFAACATLVVTFHLALLITGSGQIALLAELIMGTSLLLLRFARYATTDVYLMGWVAAAEVLFLLALLRGRWWLGCVGGGIAVGLAIMSKGPQAILQVVLPLGVFVFFMRPRPRFRLGPVVAGLVAMMVVGLAWYSSVLLLVPHAMDAMRTEIDSGNEGAKSYFLLIPYMAPWIVLFIFGVISAILRRHQSDWLLLLLMILPLAIMSLFTDSKERYMLPMLPPAAILTAIAADQQLRAQHWQIRDRLVNVCHWLVAAGIGIAFPIAAAGAVKGVQTTDGRPWLSPAVGYSTAGLSAMLILCAITFQMRWRWLLMVVPAVIILATQVLFIAGYGQSAQGLSQYRPISDMIWRIAPDAKVYNAHPRGKRPPPDVALYLNRIIEWTSDPLEIKQGNVTKFLLIPQDKGKPDPTLPPPWKALDKRGPANDCWWTFLLPPAESSL